MRIGELIKELKELESEFGDLVVEVPDYEDAFFKRVALVYYCHDNKDEDPTIIIEGKQ